MDSRLRKFGRNMDIGFYPIPVTYESHGFYSTAKSQLFSIFVLFLFIFYIINYELLPWANEAHYTVKTLTRKHHSSSDISANYANVNEGYVEERITEFVIADGPQHYMVEISLQPVQIQYYSSFFPDTVSHTKLVFGKSQLASHKSQELGQDIFPSNFETSMLFFTISISTMELVIEVRPETISIVFGRIGGLTTLLTMIAILLRLYNKSVFMKKVKCDHGRLDYKRVLETCDMVDSLREHFSNQASAAHVFHSSDEIGGTRVDMPMDMVKRRIFRHIDLEHPQWRSMKREELVKIKKNAEEVIEFTNIALQNKNETKLE